jgi:hypothetical protein
LLRKRKRTIVEKETKLALNPKIDCFATKDLPQRPFKIVEEWFNNIFQY